MQFACCVTVYFATAVFMLAGLKFTIKQILQIQHKFEPLFGCIKLAQFNFHLWFINVILISVYASTLVQLRPSMYETKTVFLRKLYDIFSLNWFEGLKKMLKETLQKPQRNI